MRYFLQLFLFAACAVVVSCGDNSVSVKDDSVDSSFTGKNVFIGDSHVQGWDLMKYFLGRSCQNKGISGESIWQITARCEEFPLGSGDQCFIIAGTNNFIGNLRTGVEPQVMISNMMGQYDDLFKKANERFSKIYFISLFPVGRVIAQTYDCQACVDQHDLIRVVNDSLEKKLKRDFPKSTFIYATAYLTGDDGFFKTQYSNDGVHLSFNGYDYLSTLVRPYVR